MGGKRMTVGEVIALLAKYTSEEFNLMMSTTIRQIIVEDNFIIVEPVGENDITIFKADYQS